VGLLWYKTITKMKKSILMVLMALCTIEGVAMLYLNEQELFYVFFIGLSVSTLEYLSLIKKNEIN